MTETELRKLAEAATPGPWEATDGVVWIDTREQVCCGRGYQECCGEPDVIGGQEKVADTNASDAAFIAAANPTAVLALLDELTALRAKVKSQAEALRPFAAEAKRYEPNEGDNDLKAWSSQFTIGDLRRAAQEAGHE